MDNRGLEKKVKVRRHGTILYNFGMAFCMLTAISFVISFIESKNPLGLRQNIPFFSPEGTRLPRTNVFLPNERAFCKTLIKGPKPCMFGIKGFHCGGEIDGRDIMFSSSQQDYYLYTRHFKYLSRPGIYLDIAANHAVAVSNTFFFDRCLDWKGVCVEANEIYFESLYTERSCILVPTCISKTDGQVLEFRPFGQRGGVIGKDYKFSKDMEKGKAIITKSMRCTNVSSVSNRFGVRKIDYMSLDVEGHEMDVLLGIDWERTVIGIITVERGPLFTNISSLLENKGYTIHNINDIDQELAAYPKFTLKLDDIFIHSSVSFGKPI